MEVHGVLVWFTLIVVKITANDRPCRPQKYGYDSVACVCDIDYCDSAHPGLPPEEQFLFVTSNKAGLRFASHYGLIRDRPCSPYSQCINNNRTVFLTLNRKNTAQTIIGFGGAITDAVGMNLDRLSPDLQDMVMNEFYGPKGLKYNMARTTIGHSDYSDGPYYYNNKTYDIYMSEWRLTYQDYNYRIPYIKKAKHSTEDQLFLIASLWTVPDWMRKYDDQGLRAEIIEDYYYSYALYISKYLEAFKKEGLEHWGISYVNEPETTLGLTLAPNISQALQVWNARQLAKFAIDYFIPMLNKDFSDINILFFDDNRFIIRSAVMRYFAQFTNLTKYIEYVALHGYLNSEINGAVNDNLHRDYPNITIIDTEFCAGQASPPKLGAWSTAIYYADILMEEINHFVSAWVDWNLVLNTEGGPHFVLVSTDACIIIADDNSRFFKQPSYYIMGHFSKYIPRGSVKIELSSDYLTNIKSAAVLRPDGFVTAQLWNPTNDTITITIKDKEKGYICVSISPNSMSTIVF